MKELGIEVPVLSTEAAGNDVALNGCATLLENIYFSTPKKTQAYTHFEKSFQENFGSRPRFPSVTTSYDAMRILLKGIEETHSTDGNVLREWLEKVENYSGVAFENIHFNEKGFVETFEDAFEMQTVRDKNFVRVE